MGEVDVKRAHAVIRKIDRKRLTSVWKHKTTSYGYSSPSNSAQFSPSLIKPRQARDACANLETSTDYCQQSVTFNGHQSARVQLKYCVPQGLVLGPLLFILYTSDFIFIAASFGVRAHFYADDSQLHLHCLAVDQSTAALRLAECLERVEGWMKSNRLKLNSDKTQFLWLGSRQQLAKINTKTMKIGEHCIESSTSAKNLGVTFDSELEMALHVNNITRSCFHYYYYY